MKLLLGREGQKCGMLTMGIIAGVNPKKGKKVVDANVDATSVDATQSSSLSSASGQNHSLFIGSSIAPLSQPQRFGYCHCVIQHSALGFATLQEEIAAAFRLRWRFVTRRVVNQTSIALIIFCATTVRINFDGSKRPDGSQFQIALMLSSFEAKRLYQNNKGGVWFVPTCHTKALGDCLSSA